MPYQTDIMDFTTRTNQHLAVPVNTMHKVLTTDTAGKYIPQGVFKKGSIIETDIELEKQKGLVENFGNVFNYWKRISRGGLSYSDAYVPAELNGWKYVSATDRVECTINSAWLVGFVSPEKYDEYVFDVQLSSLADDDDMIGVVIAYARDPVTGDTHTITAMRACNGAPPLQLCMDYGLTTPLNYVFGSRWAGLVFPNGQPAEPGKLGGVWRDVPAGCRLKVTRQGDIITVETGQFNSTELFPPGRIQFDLSADPKLAVFRGPQSYGYCALSQAMSTWEVTERPATRYPIIDIRDWTVWNYTGGTWVKTQSSKSAVIALGLLRPDWTHQNETTGKFFYLDTQQKLFRL